MLEVEDEDLTHDSEALAGFCPQCDSWALTVDGSKVQCAVCGYQWTIPDE